MAIYKDKRFAKFAAGESIDDASLREAIKRANDGSIDADLGGGLIKQRVARKGQGRRSGFRVIIAYRVKAMAVFLVGFAKKDKDDISPKELAALQLIGQQWLDHPDRIAKALELGILIEVKHDDEK